MEGNDQKNALHKLIESLNNYNINPSDIKLIIKGEEVKFNDFDIEWEDFQEEETA